MAFSIAQNWLYFDRTTASALASTVTFAAQPLAGDLLVIEAQAHDLTTTLTVTDDFGDAGVWTLAVGPITNTPFSFRSWVYYKIVGTPSGSGRSVSSTPSVSVRNFMAVVNYRTPGGVITLDGTPVSVVNTVGSANPVIGSVTTTSTDGVVIGLVHDSAGNCTAGAGFTVQTTTTGGIWQTTPEDKITTVAQAYTVAFTLATSGLFVGFALAFKVVGSGNLHKGLMCTLLQYLLPAVVSVAGIAKFTATWILPTKMADGSAIGTITGQTIYYDTVSRMGTTTPYSTSVPVGNGVSTSLVIPGLAAGTYYYALTVTVGGIESDYGMEASAIAS